MTELKIMHLGEEAMTLTIGWTISRTWYLKNIRINPN
jgi:hypothetical protein